MTGIWLQCLGLTALFAEVVVSDTAAGYIESSHTLVFATVEVSDMLDWSGFHEDRSSTDCELDCSLLHLVGVLECMDCSDLPCLDCY